MESFVAEREPLGLHNRVPGRGHEVSQMGWLCPEEPIRGVGGGGEKQSCGPGFLAENEDLQESVSVSH